MIDLCCPLTFLVLFVGLVFPREFGEILKAIARKIDSL